MFLFKERAHKPLKTYRPIQGEFIAEITTSQPQYPDAQIAMILPAQRSCGDAFYHYCYGDLTFMDMQSTINILEL